MSLDSSSSSLVSAPNERAALLPLQIAFPNRLHRGIWNVVWSLLGRTSPTPLHGWRRLLLRIFGAKVGIDVHVYPGAKIWAPWNLRMGSRSCLADGVTCYNIAQINIGEDVVISQETYLCTATHDYNDPSFPLIVAPINVEPHVWVAAGAFVSPGVTVHRGAVVGARSVVTAHVPAWSVVAGNPARFLKSRVNFEQS